MNTWRPVNSLSWNFKRAFERLHHTQRQFQEHGSCGAYTAFFDSARLRNQREPRGVSPLLLSHIDLAKSKSFKAGRFERRCGFRYPSTCMKA